MIHSYQISIRLSRSTATIHVSGKLVCSFVGEDDSITKWRVFRTINLPQSLDVPKDLLAWFWVGGGEEDWFVKQSQCQVMMVSLRNMYFHPFVYISINFLHPEYNFHKTKRSVCVCVIIIMSFATASHNFVLLSSPSAKRILKTDF